MDCTRNFDLLTRYQKNFPDKDDALASKVNKVWEKVSTQEYINNSNLISSGLLEMGIRPGDKIATITNNRPEWNFLDMGMAQIGVIHVPLFATLDEKGYRDILVHSETKLAFVSDKKLANLFAGLRDSIDSLEEIYSFNDVEGVLSWKDVLEKGRSSADNRKDEIEQIKKGINEKDWATLIYTSGTTGDPKGVMLSHQNLMSNAKSAAEVFGLQSDQRYLSILPICHVGERMGSYQTQYSGCSIYYAENLASIPNDLKDVKPHGFGSVPRVLEKVFDKIIAKGKNLTGIKKKLFFWALDLGLKYEIDGANGAWYEFQLKLANKIIFSKWREALGGNVESIGIGGAALQPRLEKVFWSAGIKLLNMYGLTETSPIITINRKEDKVAFGTVGALIDGVELKIAEDGEILCKGSNVMLGYFKNETATKEAIDQDGWFHTGDIGKFENGFLSITDRKKELFKLSNGKYVSPQAIENLCKESIFIEQIMVVGENEKFTSAIISANEDALKDWCKAEKIEFASKDEALKKEEVASHFNSVIKKLNVGIEKDEQLKRFRLVPDEWTPDSGELSPTLKLKRKVLVHKYSKEIAEIYKHESDPIMS